MSPMRLLFLLLLFVSVSSVATADEGAIGSVTLAKNPANYTYCVARDGADAKNLQEGLDWVCGQPKFTCSALLPGNICYEPNTFQAHASYAFNMYYNENLGRAEACNFNGVAQISTSNPSRGLCVFVGSWSDGSANGSTIKPPSVGSSMGSALPANGFIVLLLLVVSLVTIVSH